MSAETQGQMTNSSQKLLIYNETDRLTSGNKVFERRLELTTSQAEIL